MSEARSERKYAAGSLTRMGMPVITGYCFSQPWQCSPNSPKVRGVWQYRQCQNASFGGSSAAAMSGTISQIPADLTATPEPTAQGPLDGGDGGDRAGFQNGPGGTREPRRMASRPYGDETLVRPPVRSYT